MNPIRRYDFTLHLSDGTFPESSRLKTSELLRKYCTKWAYQVEQGSDSGAVHLQGRVSLRSKRRFTQMVGNDNFLPGAHWSVTSGGCRDFDYVLKADTRIRGPWTSEEAPPPPLTRQLKAFFEQTMFPWQNTISLLCSAYDERHIHVVFDERGGIGKSILCEALMYRGIAFDMPPLRSMQDIMSIAIDRVKKAYVIDMPRGMKKDKMGEFFSGIECLKNGRAYDVRYKYREKRFDRPTVIVFTNVLPVLELLSPDRWKIWVVNERKELQPFEQRIG